MGNINSESESISRKIRLLALAGMLGLTGFFGGCQEIKQEVKESVKTEDIREENNGLETRLKLPQAMIDLGFKFQDRHNPNYFFIEDPEMIKDEDKVLIVPSFRVERIDPYFLDERARESGKRVYFTDISLDEHRPQGYNLTARLKTQTHDYYLDVNLAASVIDLSVGESRFRLERFQWEPNRQVREWSQSKLLYISEFDVKYDETTGLLTVYKTEHKTLLGAKPRLTDFQNAETIQIETSTPVYKGKINLPTKMRLDIVAGGKEIKITDELGRKFKRKQGPIAKILKWPQKQTDMILIAPYETESGEIVFDPSSSDRIDDLDAFINNEVKDAIQKTYQ